MKIEEKYNQRVEAANSVLCVGLDSQFERLPARFLKEVSPQFAFNRWIIDQTHPYVSAYKPNMAFYEARGAQGWHELALTMQYLRENHPDIMTICDAKRGDIGSSNKGYVSAILDTLGFDAVTLQPYVGQEALQPFLDRADKACIILCRTSNPGAGEIQDLMIDGKPLWQRVAEQVRDEWNQNRNCMLVMGATAPEPMIREIVGEMTLLVPGIGTQGGAIDQVIPAYKDAYKRGIIVNVSRMVIFDDDPAATAKNLCDHMNYYR